MKSFLKNTFYVLRFTYYVFLLSFFFAPSAHAQGIAWSGRCVSNGDVATIQGLECLFTNALQVIVSLAGIVFFVMFINGGFQYLFSSGDQKKAAAASSTLTMAILGLVGVIASFLILKLIKTITGADVTNFAIPGP